VFDVKIAGIAGRCPWDSGAIRNFVSLDFVKRNALHVYPGNAQIALADGSLKASSDFIKIKVRIQEYTETVRFTLTDLVPGFDIILGDSWNKHQGVLANYGYTTNTAIIKPNVWLRRAQARLFPDRLTNPVRISHTSNHDTFLLSAVQAFRLLASGTRNGCRPAYLVMI
jgi:hypothetical protein